jgi:tetratricopeptide (TPR) repeat protein/transglutaminase-like putative cysteine protease
MGNLRAGALAALLLPLVMAAANALPASLAASVELETSDVQVAADGSFVQTVHTEIKANNDAGAMQISQISVPFNAGIQQLEIVEAHTLKANGSVIPIDVGTIYEQLPRDDQMISVTDQRVKVLLFPQFAAGDTAVYTIRLKSTHPIFPGAYWFGEVFARIGSYKEVRDTITAPAAMTLQVENHQVEFAKKQDGANTVYSWHYSAPEPQAPETTAISTLDREPRFFISSFKDYAELGRAYAEQAAPKAAVTARVKALAGQITGAESDKREQAKKIYEWVVKNIRYVAVELGRGTMVPHDTDTILTNGYGDCKDHDVLLQALLKAKGIEAESVLLNSGNIYALTEVPSFTGVNHVITYIPELKLYLDANVLAPFGTLPLTEYGKPAVHASASAAYLSAMPLLPPGADSITVVTTSRIGVDGVLTGTTKTTATGPHSIALRFFGLGVQAVGPERAAQLQLATRSYKDGTGQLAGEPPTDLKPSYSMTGNYSVPDWGDWTSGKERRMLPGGMRIFNPSGDAFMGSLYPDNIKDSEPTPCYSGRAVEDISVALPAGTRVVPLPADARVETPNLNFTAHWKYENSILSVHREFTSHIGEALCRGAVRKQTVAALKQILDNYDIQILLGPPVASYNQTIQENPQNAEALVERGNAYADKNDTQNAIADYTAALKIDPNNVYALDNRGHLYGMMGETEKAKADLDKAIALSPDDAYAYFNRGTLWLDKQQFDRAIADYNQAIKFKPDYALAYSNRCSAYARRKLFDQARKDCDKGVELDPHDVATFALRGRLFFEMEHYEEALDDLDKALALAPGDSNALITRAMVEVQLKHFNSALKDCDKALDLAPDDAAGYMIRSEVKRKLGDDYGANRDVAKAVKLDPSLAKTDPAAIRAP